MCCRRCEGWAGWCKAREGADLLEVDSWYNAPCRGFPAFAQAELSENP